MKFTYLDNNITINDTFVITDQSDNQSGLVILKRTIGPDMRYQQVGLGVVDYPGEYELNGYTIEVLNDSDGLLNYVIAIEDDYIAYLQNPKLANKGMFNQVTHWLCDRDEVMSAIDKLDSTGMIIDVRVQA